MLGYASASGFDADAYNEASKPSNAERNLDEKINRLEKAISLISNTNASDVILGISIYNSTY